MEASSEKGIRKESYGLGAVVDFNGNWVQPHMPPIIQQFHESYLPMAGDVLLASLPKTGTTWTMALLHSILSISSLKPNLLDEKHPHQIVPAIEYKFSDAEAVAFSDLTPPRLFHTHLAFHCLPEAIKNPAGSASLVCKIVYVLRNPRDTFVSFWKFYEGLVDAGMKEWNRKIPVEGLFDAFCRGVFSGGPFVSHVLSYWNEAKRNPERVLWLTFEDLQEDCVGCVLRMGRFLGCEMELMERNASSIVDKCGIERLAEVNKKGGMDFSGTGFVPKFAFFRRGNSGEWKKYVSAEMEARIKEEIEKPLEEHGIHFRYK
eukprot:TRINITY_DN33348_c0_g1_i1.p1 TRINITY_DN33348_c0_g1~~TRINITY_DN33348_c0_g1_i1.p1  ORF type:complete len:317 (+),score=39.63 TRINITY_DN33348_c0_g1_i1:73-1023(+)